MNKKKKIIISLSITMVFLISIAISYAYFSAKINGNESASTVVATSANLELTFTDGVKQISASNILPGWSDSKTIKVENTGEQTAYYVIRISDITNPFVYGGISYDIVGDNGVTIEKDTLPLMEMPVSSAIEIPVNTTHNYTITTYYNNLEESQKQDLGKSFSYTVSIEAVYKKEINYIEDLVDLSNKVNAGNKYEHVWFLQTRDLDFNSDSSYKNANSTSYGDYNGNGTVEPIKTELTTGSGFIPIGYSSDTTIRFKGSYDGQNHKLDNLYRKETTYQPALFNRVESSKITNLTLSGEITRTADNPSKGAAAALVVASYGNTVIDNCHSTANVYSNNSDSSTGGLLAASYNNLYIRNSSNFGNISSASRTGGLLGTLTNNAIVIIEKSHNEGNVTNSQGIYAGGLIGRVQNTSCVTKIYNSYNSGDVTLSNSSTSSTYVGGLAGLIQGGFNMFNSYNEGTIISENTGMGEETYANVGGLIGQINSGNIINSYNTGNISGGYAVGGLIGKKRETATHLIINKTYNTGTISNDGGYAAGILGYTTYNTNSKTIVLNSYNTGNINSAGEAGGIFGRLNTSVYPINSYNAGTISATSLATGIVAYNQSRYLYFNNVFNYGEIISSNTKYGLYYRNSGNTNSIINSYYLEGISGSNISGYTGTSLSREYMASPEFVNLLNQNKRTIDLNTIYDGALVDYADYELSDWKYDSTKGYPVLDN